MTLENKAEQPPCIVGEIGLTHFEGECRRNHNPWVSSRTMLGKSVKIPEEKERKEKKKETDNGFSCLMCVHV